MMFKAGESRVIEGVGEEVGKAVEIERLGGVGGVWSWGIGRVELLV